MKMKFGLALFFLVGVIQSASAQFESPVAWTYSAKTQGKGNAILQMRAKIKPGWHVFSQHVKAGGPSPTSFHFDASKDFILQGEMSEPKPITVYEKLFKMDISYFEKEVVFQQSLRKNVASTVVKGKLEYMACSAKECLPPEEVEFTIPVK